MTSWCRKPVHKMNLIAKASKESTHCMYATKILCCRFSEWLVGIRWLSHFHLIARFTDCLHVKGCWLDPVTILIIRYKRFVGSPVYRCYRITSCSISVLEAGRDHLSWTYLDSGCFWKAISALWLFISSLSRLEFINFWLLKQIWIGRHDTLVRALKQTCGSSKVSLTCWGVRWYAYWYNLLTIVASCACALFNRRDRNVVHSWRHQWFLWTVTTY